MESIDESSELGRAAPLQQRTQRGPGPATGQQAASAVQSKSRKSRRADGGDRADGWRPEQALTRLAPPVVANAALVVAIGWIALSIYLTGAHGVALCDGGHGRVAFLLALAAATLQDLMVLQLVPLLAALVLRAGRPPAR